MEGRGRYLENFEVGTCHLGDGDGRVLRILMSRLKLNARKKAVSAFTALTPGLQGDWTVFQNSCRLADDVGI